MSKQNVFEDLADYFDGVASHLEAESLSSRTFPNSSDRGEIREKLFSEFLSEHLPSRCVTERGGFIFDEEGRVSRQIDIIVMNDSAIRFNKGDKHFSTIQGCTAAISVKSLLGAKDVRDALNEFTSIPPMPELQINPLLKGGKKIAQDLPYCAVFSYDGPAHTAVLKAIKEYYEANNVPYNRRPDLIIVNKKYAIAKVGPEGAETAGGEKVPPHTFWPMGFKTKHIGGWSLMRLLAEIQDKAQLGSQILAPYGGYADKLSLD